MDKHGLQNLELKVLGGIFNYLESFNAKEENLSGVMSKETLGLLSKN